MKTYGIIDLGFVEDGNAYANCYTNKANRYSYHLQ